MSEIEIEIKTATHVPGTYSCYLKFCGYNKSWVEVIRQLSIRRYNDEDKTWEFPLFNIRDIVERYRNVIITIHWHKEKEPIMCEQIPDIELKRKLFPYQQVAVEYGVKHPKYLLLDTMGLGKTTSVIAEALTLKKMGKIKQCLIICCISDLQYNWAKEIETVCNEEYFILGTRYRKKKTDENGKLKSYAGSVKDRVEDLKIHKEFFLITNKETLRNDTFIDILRGKNKIKTDITFIAIDEFHKGTGDPSSISGKNLQKLNDMQYIIPMSGTILRNRPYDAWAPLTLIGKEHSTFSQFKNFYTNYGYFSNVASYKNLEYLQAQLSECSLRRTKEEVLKELPPVMEDNVYVTMNERQQLIYDEAYSLILENIDKISESPNPLAQLIRLRQATGYTGILSTTIHESAKNDRIEEDVASILEYGEKCLIFSNWTNITDNLYDRLSKKYKVLRITGKDVHSGDEVEEIKRKFQNDPEYKILIGTTSKMGTGHTLTAANWVLFADEPWTKADKDQAVMRTHRPGQNKTVFIRTYITKETIDEKVNEIVEGKGEMADFVIDGKTPKERKKDYLKYLLDID